MSTSILIVEDDPDIAALVARYLDKAGYATHRAASGRDALRLVEQNTPDLIVLDLMLPHVDGLEVCRLLRSNDATAAIPVIMLTARAEESDRIVGLELGADDYLPKPFSPNELVARVRALLRRAHRAQGAPPGTVAPPLTYGPIALDTVRHVVSCSGREVVLTAKEFLLLKYLLSTAAGCCHGMSCSPTSGATDIPAALARLTCTSAACAKNCRSSPTRSSPSSSSVTSWPTRRRSGVMRATFQTKFFFAALSAALLALAVAGILFATTISRRTNARIESTLVAEARLAAELLGRGAAAAPTDIAALDQEADRLAEL